LTYAGDVAARAVEAGDQAKLDRVATHRKNNLNVGRYRLSSWSRKITPAADDHGYLTANQLSCQRRKAIMLTFCPSVLDGDILSLDEAAFFQALAKCC
jgi:hypothetical protein